MLVFDPNGATALYQFPHVAAATVAAVWAGCALLGTNPLAAALAGAARVRAVASARRA
jgi:hypothetical protein